MEHSARKKRRRDQGQPCPGRGRRYNQQQRRAILAWEAKHGLAAAVDKFGVSAGTVQSWHERHPQEVKAAKQMAKSRARAKQTSRAGAAAAGGVPRAKADKPGQQKSRKQEREQEREREQEQRGSAARRARHGRRFSAAEKKAILEAAEADGVTAAAKEHGTSRYSIYEWRRRIKNAKTEKAQERALQPRSSKPKRNARKLSEERYNLIADTWKKNQALGPRQVRNKVRRDHGIRVGTATARKVMEEHGYVPPKVTIERRDVRRYEAVRPNQQVHLDFLHFYVHKAKVYLLLIEDDYSRFITGWALCDGERAQPVIEAVDGAISRYGKPEQMVIDGGSGFFSWRGQS